MVICIERTCSMHVVNCRSSALLSQSLLAKNGGLSVDPNVTEMDVTPCIEYPVRSSICGCTHHMHHAYLCKLSRYSIGIIVEQMILELCMVCVISFNWAHVATRIVPKENIPMSGASYTYMHMRHKPIYA